MERLTIKNFKAFDGELDILLNKKNLLVYGENGSGKSSIFEAIKLIFFKDRLNNNIPRASTPEEQEQNNKEFWNQFNNTKAKHEFEILLNDSSYTDIDILNYQVFMYSPYQVSNNEPITLKKLISHFYLNLLKAEFICF